MRTALYGAIIGDMVGSPYEGKLRVIKTKDFPLFGEDCHLTDDTILTVVVAEALLAVDVNADEVTMKTAVIRSMQSWGRKHLTAAFSSTFRQWLMQDNPQPCKKITNGSAMRVSAVGCFFDTLDRTLEVARQSAQVSHDTPEAIRGAQSVASAIFLARNAASKDEIKSYVTNNFGYDLSRTLDEIRPTYSPRVRCDLSVPEAIISFLEATDFEDALRNTVSLGGDSDTLAAIAGSIAEAFYGVPDELIAEGQTRLAKDMLEVLRQFNGALNFC